MYWSRKTIVMLLICAASAAATGDNSSGHSVTIHIRHVNQVKPRVVSIEKEGVKSVTTTLSCVFTGRGRQITIESNRPVALRQRGAYATLFSRCLLSEVEETNYFSISPCNGSSEISIIPCPHTFLDKEKEGLLWVTATER